LGASVYILRCADGSYYVGSTRVELEQRIGRHNAGHCRGYTFKRRPVTLVYHEHFDRITDAIAAERQLKDGIGQRRTR
jgi:putative endonuclease